MSWVVNKLVQIGIDLLVKLILKWIADQEAQRSKNPTGENPIEKPPVKPPENESGWGDKSIKRGPGEIV